MVELALIFGVAGCVLSIVSIWIRERPTPDEREINAITDRLDAAAARLGKLMKLTSPSGGTGATSPTQKETAP